MSSESIQMARKRIKEGARLRDVAAAAGVSRTTASAVINGKAEEYGICAATRARVEAAIRQLGYVPSQAALDMVAGRNSLVGLAVSGERTMADRLIAILEPALAQAGYRLMVTVLPADPQSAAARLTDLDRYGLAGLAVWPTDDIAIPKLSRPAIVIGKSGTGLPSVYEDEPEGGRQLAGRLIDKNHRTIAIIGTASPGVNGFLEACAKAGVGTRVFATAKEMLDSPQSATAVFCSTPQALLELYSRCAGAGLQPGVDLAVVGADAFGMAASLTPRPTTLHPGLARLGQVAAQWLKQAIQGTSSGDCRLIPVIADGESVCAPPAPKKPSESIQMANPAISEAELPTPKASPVRTPEPPVVTQTPKPQAPPSPVPATPRTPPPAPPPVAPVRVATAATPVSPATVTSVPQQDPTPSDSEPPATEASEPAQVAETPSESIQMPESAVTPDAEPPPIVTPPPEPIVEAEPPQEPSPAPEIVTAPRESHP